RWTRCGGWLFDFFFQAEDGIRDFHVTGVQTCALPILFLCPTGLETSRCLLHLHPPAHARNWKVYTSLPVATGRSAAARRHGFGRSEERRVGEGCAWRWGAAR